MSYDTFTLTGTVRFPGNNRGQTGKVKIIPSERLIKDAASKVLIIGREVVELEADTGTFSIELPDPNDPTLNPTGFGYTVVVETEFTHIPARSFDGSQIVNGALDIAQIIPVDPSSFQADVQYVAVQELNDEIGNRQQGDTDTLAAAQEYFDAHVPNSPDDIGALPVSYTPPTASQSTAGILPLASSAEATAGTDNSKAMTPARVKQVVDALWVVISGGAAIDRDSFAEVAAIIANDESGLAAVSSALATKVNSSTYTTAITAIQNLTDPVLSAALTAVFAAKGAQGRTDLGLGTAATHAYSDYEPAGSVAAEATARNTAISTAITNLINGAPGALDTLKEITDQLASDESAATALTNLVTALRDGTNSTFETRLSAVVGSLANAPKGTTVVVRKDPATGFWPTSYASDGTPSYSGGSGSTGVRPTARDDLTVIWKGAAPFPPTVSSPSTAGVRDNVDMKFEETP